MDYQQNTCGLSFLLTNSCWSHSILLIPSIVTLPFNPSVHQSLPFVNRASHFLPKSANTSAYFFLIVGVDKKNSAKIAAILTICSCADATRCSRQKVTPLLVAALCPSMHRALEEADVSVHRAWREFFWEHTDAISTRKKVRYTAVNS